MVQPVRLKLDGRAFEMKRTTPTGTKIQEFLSKAPADDLFSAAQIAQEVGVSPGSIKGRGAMLAESLEPYTAIFMGKRVWGNPKAIAELLRQVKHEGC